jgi:hypothetical protein
MPELAASSKGMLENSFCGHGRSNGADSKAAVLAVCFLNVPAAQTET